MPDARAYKTRHDACGLSASSVGAGIRTRPARPSAGSDVYAGGARPGRARGHRKKAPRFDDDGAFSAEVHKRALAESRACSQLATFLPPDATKLTQSPWF